MTDEQAIRIVHARLLARGVGNTELAHFNGSKQVHRTTDGALSVSYLPKRDATQRVIEDVES